MSCKNLPQIGKLLGHRPLRPLRSGSANREGPGKAVGNMGAGTSGDVFNGSAIEFRVQADFKRCPVCLSRS